VRVRTTAGATLVVALALAVAGVALVAALRSALTDGVERSTRQQARAAAEVVGAGATPGVLAGGDDDTVAQVLDAKGRVVRASPALGDTRELLLADPAPGRSATVHLPGSTDSEEYRAVATAVGSGGGTLILASSLEEVERAVSVVTGLLVVGLPLLLVLVAAVTWWVVGRALRPVEAIRATAAAVSPDDPGRRVPEPATRDEVARLAATMNGMLDRLESAQARQRRFVADASHELRSPVATLRQHAEVALAHPGSSDDGDLADTVLAEALRLQHLIDDLLLLARADADGLVLRRRPVDLDDLVLDEVRRLRSTTDLEVDAAGVSAGGVDGDAAALARVVRNVVDNAARHAARRVRLTLTATGEAAGDVGGDGGGGGGGAGAVVLAVEDDGPGIPEAERARVFERFVRLDDARARDGGGSGLGLAIVAEVVAAHGGTVAIADAGLGGARVEVRLPARETPGSPAVAARHWP
jgi:signal transduction histidine kinase